MRSIPILILALCSFNYAFANATVTPSQPIDHTGVFFGGGFGGSQEDWSTDNGSQRDFDGAALVAFGGFHFTHWFGLEGFINANTEEHAVFSASVSPKFTLAVNDKFSFFFKAGLNFVSSGDLDDDDRNRSGSGSGSSGNSNNDDDDDDIDIDWLDIFFSRSQTNHNSRTNAPHAQNFYYSNNSSFGSSEIQIEGDSGSGFGYTLGLGVNINVVKKFNFRVGFEYLDTESEYEGSSSSTIDNFEIDHEISTFYAAVYFQL